MAPTLKPVVGVCVSPDVDAALLEPLTELGAEPFLLPHSSGRYRMLKHVWGIRRIACVIDADPNAIIQATSLGTDAVIWDQPENRFFSWHLRAVSVDDAVAGIGRLIQIWRDKQAHD